MFVITGSLGRLDPALPLHRLESFRQPSPALVPRSVWVSCSHWRLVVTFVPALLMVAGALPFWEALRQCDRVQRAVAGINAAVVGVLGSALYDPVWTSAIQSRADFGLALAAFGLLVYARLSPVLVAAMAAAAGWLRTQ